MRLGQLAIVAGGALGLAGAAFGQGDGGVSGRWLTADGKAVIAIARCGASLCGAIDWMKAPLHDGVPARDVNNPDTGLRSRPLCGLIILSGFHQDPSHPGYWTDGRIYSPEKGNIYHAEITAQDSDHIALRGYIGIPLLGESQIWSRAPASLAPCRQG
jgi:uncharacterized protein (DUF2147 family)